MKKFFKYFGLFLIIELLIFILGSNHLGIFTESTESFLWRHVKLLIITGMISFTVTSIVFFIAERKRVAPYFYKLYTFRSLLFQLVRRDFKAKYKRSVLGILWTVLNPLLTMIVLTIVFSSIFRFDIENFPVYLLSGQVIFTFFSEATNLSMGSILGGSELIKKVNIPKYIFPVSRVISSLVNFLFSLVALLIVMLITKAHFYPTMVLMIIPIFYTFVFSLGIGLILSAAVVFFRDMTYLYGILLTAMTYFTPLFYPISIIPEKFRMIISLNPMFHLVEYFRTVTIYGGVPTLWQNMLCFTFSLVSFTIGLYVFYKQQDRFILYV